MYDCGTRGADGLWLPAGPENRIVEHSSGQGSRHGQIGLPRPREMGLWTTGRVVPAAPLSERLDCSVFTVPQDCGPRGKLCPLPRDRLPRPGDRVVEHGGSCVSRAPGDCGAQGKLSPSSGPLQAGCRQEVGLWKTGRAVRPADSPPPLRRYDCGTRGKL